MKMIAGTCSMEGFFSLDSARYSRAVVRGDRIGYFCARALNRRVRWLTARNRFIHPKIEATRDGGLARL